MKTNGSLSNYLLLALLLLLVLPSCKNAYKAADFEDLTIDHNTVAVLPFQMVFLGKAPENLTKEEILAIEEAESEAFQVSFLNEILRSTTRGRRNIRVDMQPHSTTMAILKKKNIGIRDSWEMGADELAKVLGVDAVVRARVEKTRYMSDLASLGIEAGVEILRAATGGVVGPWIPGSISRSKEIAASYSLLDTDGNRVLWSVACDVDANWRSRSNDIIDRLNHLSAKRFPYRK